MTSPGPPRPSADASAVALDTWRGLASLVVMVGHLRALFFIPLSGLRAPSLLVRLVYAATSLGHQAVMVFFVLSGYLVGGSVVRAVRARRWSWHEYLARRTARLYVVLVPALLLTALWDQLGIRFLAQSGLYQPNPDYAYILPFSIAGNERLTAFVGNGVFVQTIVVPPFGSNSPRWSLANEWWYYLMFPLLVVLVAPTRSPAARLASAVGGACIAWFVGVEIAAYFGIWLLGAGLAVVPTRPLTGRLPRVAVALTSAAVVVAALGFGGAHP
ncbi:MAG TPA: acyltransferase family protein, partial [Gemmatirosa sp.]